MTEELKAFVVLQNIVAQFAAPTFIGSQGFDTF